MSGRTRLGLYTLGFGALLGVVADLLRASPAGINVLLLTAAVAGAGIYLLYRGDPRPAGEGRWLLAPVLLFAALFAWRDAGLLQFANTCALSCAFALVVARSRAGGVRIAGLGEYAGAALQAGGHAAFGAIPLLGSDVRWDEVPHGRWQGQAVAVARGVFIAIPLLLVFGCLFTLADAVFARLLSDIFRIDLADALTHTFFTLLAAWLIAGLLRMAVLTIPSTRAAGGARAGLGATEIAIALGLLNVLFFAFVVVQIRYLFGGSDMITEATGLTYAEYARRGFFELATVTALVLPVLLGAHWLLRPDRPAGTERLFRALAGLLVALLFVIMASALQRMRLYVDAYGLTELRLYTTAFMGWLALVFVWLVVTVLRGHRERFAFGALLAGFLVVIGLNVLNPDAVIALTNVGRPQQVVRFDVDYAVQLSSNSADAVPVLIENLDRMKPDEQRTVAQALLREWSAPAGIDWRTWNYSRINAYWAVSNHQAQLAALAGSTGR